MTNAKLLAGVMPFIEELECLLHAHDEWVRYDAVLDEYDDTPPLSACWRAEQSWRHYDRLRREFRARLGVIDEMLVVPDDAA